MTAVLMRLGSELRTRWRTWLSLTLILGLFGGAVIAIAAGARRTDSAYRRFLTSSRAYDVVVPRFTGGDFLASLRLGRVEKLPQVAEALRFHIYGAERDLEVAASGDPGF